MILLAINEKRRHTDPAIVFYWCFNSATKQRLENVRPIVINSRGQSARLTQRFLIDLDVLIREDIMFGSRLFIHSGKSGEIIRSGPSLGQSRQLEKDHEPTVTQLPQSKVFAPGCRWRYLHRHQP